MSQNEKNESEDFFIDYLNKEIDQIREDIKMPGWTSWAILAALASIGWILLFEVENNIYNFEQACLLFLLMSFAYPIARELYDFSKPSQPNKRLRYSTSDILFREKRLTISINYVQFLLIITILISISKQVGVLPYYL